MNILIAIIISFLILVGVYREAPKMKLHLVGKVFAQPVATVTKWVDATDNLTVLKKFSDIQKTMGGVYAGKIGTYEYLLNRAKSDDGRNWHFEVYEDGDYQITLGFYYNQSRDRIKVAYGGIGKCKNYRKGQRIAWNKIVSYLRSQNKNGYAIVDANGLDIKAVGWYQQIKPIANEKGVVVREQRSGDKIILEFDVE